MKIRTCPDIHFLFENFKFGHVRIFIYQWEISIPDMSEFQLRTCPYFNFSIAKFKIRTRPDFNSGHVRISIFQLQNFKSRHVQISIPDFRFSRGMALNIPKFKEWIWCWCCTVGQCFKCQTVWNLYHINIFLPLIYYLKFYNKSSIKVVITYGNL